MFFESSTASVYSLISSWFTPSSLFIFVNLVIGIIAITSRFATPKRQLTPHHHHDSPSQLVRSPSLLDRLTSFNLGLHKYQPTIADSQLDESTQSQLVRAPSLLDRVKSINLGLCKTEHSVSQPESENGNYSPEPHLTRAPSSLLERLKSVKLFRSESIQEEKKESNEPEISGMDSGRGRGNLMEKSTWDTDALEEVDAKADDFINRFKQQLRLQRLDSILRYREMLKRN